MKELETRRLEAINPQGVGLRIEFVRQGQRWLHQVFAVHGRSLLPILASVEGDDNQQFPPSPPVQQLVLDKRADGVQVALSVGMAGKSHWSACVEAFPATAIVRLDVACHCHPGSGDQLGSTYIPLVPWYCSDGPASLSTRSGNCHCCLLPQLVEGGQTAVVSLQKDRIAIRPVVDDAVRTQRWCYELQCTWDGAPG